MIESLSIPELAEHCQAEADRYRQTGQSDETYCFELFRLALVERDEAAWHAIYTQYEGLVAHWVHAYASGFFDKEPEDFVNETFARMWQYGVRSETAEKLDGLGKCLAYLKKCAWSSVEDRRRWQDKDALSKGERLDDWREQGAPALSPGDQIERNELLAELRQALAETLQTSQERLIAEESWGYGQTPRQIQARYPETFASVEAVSQAKRNILKRLRRRLTADV
jgi:RNA polymerase sigma factor (sigma-70 family)